MEDVGEDFELGNAFSWIAVDLECRSCFKKYYKFIDYETSWIQLTRTVKYTIITIILATYTY